jgi:hypothetical protein
MTMVIKLQTLHAFKRAKVLRVRVCLATKTDRPAVVDRTHFH